MYWRRGRYSVLTTHHTDARHILSQSVHSADAEPGKTINDLAE